MDKLQNSVSTVFKNSLKRILVESCFRSGPGSVVGIATGYGLDGPGIKSQWGEISHTCPNRPWSPPSLLYNGYQVFPGGGGGWGVGLTPPPHPVPRS